MKYFNDKVIWITGASSGIGAALAVQLSKLNVKLVLSARNEVKLQALKSELNLKDEQCLVLPLDLGAIDSHSSKVKEVIQYFGQVDILINNAGLSYRGIAAETNLSVDRQLMEINYFGTISLTKAVLPYMLERKSGHIAVTTSIAGKVGTQIRSAYSASKHALHGFFDCLRMETYKQNIPVTIVVPGFVKTDLTLKALTEDGSSYNHVDDAIQKGMSSEACAKQYLRALSNQVEEVVIAEGKERIAPILKRYYPTMLTRLLKRLDVM